MDAHIRERTLSAIASLAIVAGGAATLVFGLRPHWHQAVRTALVAVDFVAPPRPEREHRKSSPPQSKTPSAATGDPAPAALKNRASPVFVPIVQPPLIPPPPIIAAPVTALGAAAANGAALVPGPGQGAGGTGNGLGGGGTGGDGSGSGGAVKRPKQISGHLSYSDLPQGLLQSGQEAGASVRYVVNPDGTVSDCRIDRSSGFPALDSTACRLIEQRFRYRPARNKAGEPVPATIVEDHVWIARGED